MSASSHAMTVVACAGQPLSWQRTFPTVCQESSARGFATVCKALSSSVRCAGSMAGARETVAKAVALECMRGAHRQQRQCYLYAFRCTVPAAGRKQLVPVMQTSDHLLAGAASPVRFLVSPASPCDLKNGSSEHQG